MSKVKKASRHGVWGRSRNPLPTPPHSLTPLISEDFLPSRSIWRRLWICRDLFYSSCDISWLGICTSCRKKLAMLMKGVTANKTDEDEPEVRRSSRLAEKSPVSFENLFLSPGTPLPFGQELSLAEPLRLLVINPLNFIVISLSAKKKTTLLRS